ncbi:MULTISPECIES: hypothetical protein [Sporosarcina]|uniref:Uncharacterized protein n=1 Tax=Sporosarcina contaminans TaxID=633403 RepID=A0ABW3TXZ4_9BACL
MANEKRNQMADMLLQSLYDYHYAYNGASYNLPKAMLEADAQSKAAIEYLIENDYAADSGQGTESLVLAITKQGMDYINNK